MMNVNNMLVRNSIRKSLRILISYDTNPFIPDMIMSYVMRHRHAMITTEREYSKVKVISD